jgi:V/A-type H+-transporting ATPase subunit D
MTGLLGQPPGRSGLLWLSRRLDTARRGGALLERTLVILRQEHRRVAEHAGHSRDRWHQCAEQARTWLTRSALVAGESSVPPALVTGDGEAQVSVRWAATMGLRYPAAAELVVPPERLGGPPVSSAALLQARAAHELALHAAVDHAVAAAATRMIDTEIIVTGQRLRAIEDRWIPRLEAARRELALALADVENAEQARLRRAMGAARP